MDIVIATKNEHKKNEILKICNDIKDISFLTLKDFPLCPEVEEDGKTFEDNAIKKAIQVSLYTGMVALADDSGLVVEKLNGAPGIYSARFSGINATSKQNNEKLLDLLKDYNNLEDRKAKFVCAMALVYGDKILGLVSGECSGYILTILKGENGFGYDPLFFVPAYKKTFAELSPDIKNKISHRAVALEQVKSVIASDFSSLLNNC